MKLLTVDLERPLPDIPAPSVGQQWVLVRLHGAPLGILPFAHGGCRAAELARTIGDRFALRILRHLTADHLWAEAGTSVSPAGIPVRCPKRLEYSHPRMTVAVCTRNGGARMSECLDALVAIDYPSDRLDLLVIDNASDDNTTAELIATGYPRVRCIAEPRPGLDWARNRAILEARGDIIAFTDDDVSVDAGWADAIARVFAEEPHVECVTGLVVPDAIDTPSHHLFEQYGGFGRGFERRYYRVNGAAGERAADRHAGAGMFGTGANMAFRRSLFDRIGLFDPALDVGTPANGGGDLEMFFRLLKLSGTLVYEPSAFVRHRHRQTHEQLRTQLENNGIGFYTYLVRSARAYPEERRALLRMGLAWYYQWNIRRLVHSLVSPGWFPSDLAFAEARGALAGLRRYTPSRRVAEQVLATYGPQTPSAS